jgi:hypothetical protein
MRPERHEIGTAIRSAWMTGRIIPGVVERVEIAGEPVTEPLFRLEGS